MVINQYRKIRLIKISNQVELKLIFICFSSLSKSDHFGQIDG